VGKCIIASEGYFYSGFFFFSRLVTFLICGNEKVNVAHFSFFMGCVGCVGEGEGEGFVSFPASYDVLGYG